MPIGGEAKRALLDFIPEFPTGSILELGSGWGGLAKSLAKRFPERNVVGFEVSPIPYFVSICRYTRWGYKAVRNLNFKKKDFIGDSWEGAALAVCYLCPKAMKRIALKLKEIKKPLVLISYTFALPGFKECKSIKVSGSNLYLTPV